MTGTGKVLVLAGILAVAISVLRWRRARRRRQAWMHRHFHQGGLIATLIARWRPTPRLTDRRHDRRDDDG